MAVTYAWSFPTLDVVYNEVDPVSGEPVQNVVTAVHWIYTATDGVFSASTYSVAQMQPPGVPFIAYEDLTPEIVQGWVEAALGPEQLAAMNESLANQIAAQQNPTGGALPPPWTQPQA